VVQAVYACSRRSRRSENVRKGTISDRDSVMIPGASDAAFLRRLAGRRSNVVGKAGEVALVDEREAIFRFVGEHVLHESRRQHRKALDDGPVACLAASGEPGARADEIEMNALGEAPLFSAGRQLIAATVDGFDPREELRVHRGRAVVGGELRRDVALDRLQVGGSLRRGQIEEQPFDPMQAVAALSSAAMVLSNVGGSGFWAMALTSARCACIAWRNAGR
jgi:hypothetical protein